MSEPEGRELLFSCIDHLGREVELYQDTWYDHVLANRPELANREAAVRRALTAPDHIRIDRFNPNARVYYKKGDLPPPNHASFVRVVVKFISYETDDGDAQEIGRVATAYLVSSLVHGEAPEW